MHICAVAKGNSNYIYDNNIFLTRWTFKIIKVGNQRELELDDIDRIPLSDSTQVLGDKVHAAWEKEKREQTNPSLLRTLRRLFVADYVCLAVLGTIGNAVFK